MNLGDRITDTLSRAHLSPRHIGGATQIHYVTIYRTMRDGDESTSPITKHALTAALNKIDALIEKGDLPMQGKLSRKEKTDRLIAMLEADH